MWLNSHRPRLIKIRLLFLLALKDACMNPLTRLSVVLMTMATVFISFAFKLFLLTRSAWKVIASTTRSNININVKYKMSTIIWINDTHRGKRQNIVVDQLINAECSMAYTEMMTWHLTCALQVIMIFTSLCPCVPNTTTWWLDFSPSPGNEIRH